MAPLKNSDNASTYWWVSLFKGVLLIVIGIWILKTPIESFNTLSFILGLIIMLSGILEIIIAVRIRKDLKNWGWNLLAAIVDTIIGISLMANPEFILLLITFFISFWLILRGVLSIRESFILKSKTVKNWYWTLVLGIVLILCAAVLIWHPIILGITIIFWTAIAFISLGILRIILSFRIKNSQEQI